MMTKEKKLEVYNKVRTHLLTQGKKASNDGKVCRYKSDDGLKCAVGCLITDEAYDPEIESKSLWNKKVVEALAKSGLDNLSDDDLYFLKQLQIIHDERDPSEWGTTLNEFKVAHELE